MVHNRSLLTKTKEVNHEYGNKVNLPTGEQVNISHMGESSILKDRVVHDVLYIPDFKYKLLSVSKITKELCCVVVFFPDFCIFQDISSMERC